MNYCIDTSALIAAWAERYPPRNFRAFWEKMDGLAKSGRLSAPEEVRREIEKKADGLYDWVNERKTIFVDLEEPVQEAAREILKKHRLLVKSLPGRSPADPFVIALAKARGLTVITEEGRGSVKRPKIPDVCEDAGIECINLIGLINQEDWII